MIAARNSGLALVSVVATVDDCVVKYGDGTSALSPNRDLV